MVKNNIINGVYEQEYIQNAWFENEKDIKRKVKIETNDSTELATIFLDDEKLMTVTFECLLCLKDVINRIMY